MHVPWGKSEKKARSCVTLSCRTTWIRTRLDSHFLWIGTTIRRREIVKDEATLIRQYKAFSKMQDLDLPVIKHLEASDGCFECM